MFLGIFQFLLTLNDEDIIANKYSSKHAAFTSISLDMHEPNSYHSVVQSHTETT